MSAAATKYANLPDIDTAPDVYETEDPPEAPATKSNGDDDSNANNRRGGGGDSTANPEELDVMPGMSHDEASDKFRKAEKRAQRMRVLYESAGGEDDEGDGKKVRLDLRLKALQAELSALEAAVADPTREQKTKKSEGGETVEDDEEVDTGELIRGLADVRGRLGLLRHGRARLVGRVLKDSEPTIITPETGTPIEGDKEKKDGTSGLVGLDERVGQLERIVGSSTTALDELSPLPPPLVPLITRLNSQVTLLTQPRHIDSISRRLKLLLSDLDRSAHAHGRKGAGPAEGSHQQLLPLLNRLAGAVPQIPHILTRLKTLAVLHAAAGDFEESLRTLEEEQKRVREALNELEGAVGKVEASIDENRGVVKTNVEGLETRMDSLFKRLESV